MDDKKECSDTCSGVGDKIVTSKSESTEDLRRPRKHRKREEPIAKALEDLSYANSHGADEKFSYQCLLDVEKIIYPKDEDEDEVYEDDWELLSLIFKHHGAETVLDLMKLHRANQDIMLSACKVLYFMVSESFNPDRNSLRDFRRKIESLMQLGTAQMMMTILDDFKDHFYICWYLLRAIGTVLKCNYQSKTHFDGVDIEQRVVSLMKRFDGSETNFGGWACFIISELCKQNYRRRKRFVDLGVCPLVFNALVDYHMDNDCRSWELDALEAIEKLIMFPDDDATSLFAELGIEKVLDDIVESTKTEVDARNKAIRLRSKFEIANRRQRLECSNTI
jgi:DNA-directed RNA polymerase specialized sigma24 family protein